MITSVHVSIGVGDLYSTTADVATTNGETYHVSFNASSGRSTFDGRVSLYGDRDALLSLLKGIVSDLETVEVTA